MFVQISKEFRKALGNAVDQGELKTDINLNDLADYLANVMRNTAIMARSGFSRKELAKNTRIALNVLN